MRLRTLFIFVLAAFALAPAHAQRVIDEVAAVVGEEFVLLSEIRLQQQQMSEAGVTGAALEECAVLEQIVQRKLLLARARADSVVVSPEQVSGEIDRRIQYFVEQIGDAHKLEQFYGRSIAEMKEDFRTAIEEQLLIEQMQHKMTEGVDVTPAEVRKFYNSIPGDSLPYYNTEVELSQIVIHPKISDESREAAIRKLRGIREDLMNGASFAMKARVYSDDRGSRENGGRLGLVPLSNLVPEFATVARKLKKDSISDVVKTDYGYHVIQMIERRGELVDVRHILIKPEITADAFAEAEKLIDSIRTAILHDTLTFIQAAYQFSEDKDTRNRGGVIVDPKTAAAKFPVEELDQSTFYIVDTMSVGSVSPPHYIKTYDGKDTLRILYLQKRIPPHKANLKEDYPQLKNLALQFKKIEATEKWFKRYMPLTYFKAFGKYENCPALDKYRANNSARND